MTLCWAILDLVVFVTESNSLHLLFNFPLAKIYTNSLMSTLNARRTQADTLHTSGTGNALSRKMGDNTTVTASMPAWDRPKNATVSFTSAFDLPLSFRVLFFSFYWMDY